VKYFNAEKHEEERFENALVAYKKENIKVTKGVVLLNNA
jgi:ABC-type transport system involved in Fe-S cluster assembly fused permease/ATPase subunit